MGDIFSFNSGWSFHGGDISLRNFQASHAERFDSSEWLKAGNMGISKPGYPEDETKWKRVELPHDFVLENDFTPQANYVHGSLPVGIGWYRKDFLLPEEDEGKRIFLEFDGIFRNSSIWVNGHYAGGHLSGYTSFSVDISEVCLFGEANGIAVRVDASEFELWSYEGGGIYRDVRLVKKEQIHIPQYGSYFVSQVNPWERSAHLRNEITVANGNLEDREARLSWTLLDPQGNSVFSLDESLSLKGDDTSQIVLEGEIGGLSLWDVDNPSLYTSRITVRDEKSHSEDSHEIKHGFRSLRFDSAKGFFLNELPLKLKGTCCHQDHGGVGIAVPYSLQEWRIARLKEMGSNALRTSHNPPDPRLLDACDRLGMLVMDEQRMIGTSDEILGQLEDLIIRDRNHPSVILWSLGNEEVIQHSETALKIFRRMEHRAKVLDSSRPTTYAMNATWIETCDLYGKEELRFDVFGSNYRSGQKSEHYDIFHKKHPDWPLVGTETGGSASTRGLYEPEKSSNHALKIGNYGPCLNIQWTNPERAGFVCAYGETCTPWGYSVEETWKDCASRPFMSGTFLWTGYDYRGETFPYGWPSVVTRYGIMDLCGFPKDAFYYYRAWWRKEEPMVHIFPHWDWRGREGEAIEVWCYANCPVVELRLNGQSLGRKTMEENGKLVWFVPYESGTLEGVGFDEGGREIARKTLRTPSVPAAIELYRENPVNVDERADGETVYIISARIVDREGEWCQRADNYVTFDIEGQGRFLGSGNGNPISLERDGDPERNSFCGLSQILVEAGRSPGELKIRAHSAGLESGEISFDLRECVSRPAVGRYENITLKEEKKGEIDNLL